MTGSFAHFINVLTFLGLGLFVSLFIIIHGTYPIVRKILNIPEDFPPPPLYSLFRSQYQLLVILIYVAILLLFYLTSIALWNDPPSQKILPVLTISQRMILYPLGGLVGGFFAWAVYVLQFNGGYARIRSIRRAQFILFVIGTIFAFSTLLSAFSLWLLSFIGFIAVYFWHTKPRWEGSNTNVNLMDLEALLRVEQKCASNLSEKQYTPQRKLCSNLERGQIFRAYCRFKLYTLWKGPLHHQEEPDKQLLKLQAMLYYRLERYHRALHIAVEGNKKLAKRRDFSETLVSLGASAQVHMGLVREAEHTLRDELDRSPDNPYFMYDLAYVYWQDEDIDAALKRASTAIEHFPDQAEQLVSALELKAHLLCDFALTKYPRNASKLNDSISEAQSLIKRANNLKQHIQESGKIRFGSRLPHTLGYIYLLDRNYSKALALFSECVWRSSHFGARFHIGLLHMVGTRDYKTAIAHFEWILNTLRLKAQWQQLLQRHATVEYKLRFYRLVENNLRRAREAGKLGIVFSDDIIFYQLNFEELIPESAIAYSEREIEKYVRLRKSLFDGLTTGPVHHKDLDQSDLAALDKAA